MMKRGPVQLRRIEDKTSRQVRFSKRRSGLFNKAFMLASLCDAEVALLVFSPAGKLYEYTSSSSIEETYTRYKQFTSVENDVNNRNVNEDTGNVQNNGEDPYISNIVNEISDRCNSRNIDQMDARELDKLTDDLLEALKLTRSRKVSLTERAVERN
ncbi:MADS-box transcription factor [Rhynchospora pubera]|uniref:MADS-box transcription factor n=1 Tax=Rhynchospora pubera TaxID=906938 RepID=A0AAV8G3B9_9POAL|nr:MADS-box transcription factor [Rhynchospora pubera]